MNKIIVTTLLIILAGCSKEVDSNNDNDNSCMCYEQHETYLPTQTPQGTITNKWEVQYTTPATNQPCTNATEYYSTGNGSRAKVICN